MKIYKVKISKRAKQDLRKVISYIKNNLLEEPIADKYRILFREKIDQLEYIAESMPILNEELTGHKDIRKVNVKNYVIFYTVDEEKEEAYVIRVGHVFMDWQKYLKDI